MKLLTWNILHGGGPRRIPELTLAIIGHDADVIVLTEWRPQRGGQLAAVLADKGWIFQSTSAPHPNKNGVLIASRLRGSVSDFRARNGHSRIATLLLDSGLAVLGIHVPPTPRAAETNDVWADAIQLAKRYSSSRCVILGDLNAGKTAADGLCPTSQRAQLGRVLSAGYVDAWRALHPAAVEHSWAHPDGRASRVDYALVSKSCAEAVRSADHDRSAMHRRLSDHAALVVRLDDPDHASFAEQESHQRSARHLDNRPNMGDAASVESTLFG